MKPLMLDQHRNLFRDEESFRKFVRILTSCLSQDFSPIVADESVLGSVVSPETTKEVLYERMIRRTFLEK